MTASASATEIAPFGQFASSFATVVGRSIFYNNSRFDGDQPAADAADDGAIATDKTALLPGQQATFANYTSYSGGINGVMVDIAGLNAVPTVSDFSFRVGNNNSPSAWSPAPAPQTIAVRPGAGAGGSTRVTITWADGAIRNTWLQVELRATSNTGLASPEVFYFGNAIGESGLGPVFGRVDATDQLAPRNNPRGFDNPAGVTQPQDFNRDGLVGPADELIARKFATGLFNALRRITPGSQPTMADPAFAVLASDPTTDEAAYADFVSAQVVARNVFYNNSEYDGRDPAATAADDRAIATDKSALLPGGIASFANYTGYSRGINGVMIDVAGLPGQPTIDDFEFHVGNTADAGGWLAAPQPLSITVRPGAGVGGSARITLIWADGAIQKQWLKVTLKATHATGLKTPDVFYFGNAVGEAGNSAQNARVDATDRLMARNNWRVSVDPVPISAVNDHNRDGIVDSADEWIAARATTAFDALRLITAPAEVPAPAPQRLPIELFTRGDAGFNVFFAPTLVRANDGTLLAIAEARSGEDDHSSYALVLRRSGDGGQSWSPISTIYRIKPGTADYVGNPSPVVDAITGQIFLLFAKNNSTVFVTSSSDHGGTWSAPREITTGVKITSEGNPNPAAFGSTPWGWYATGPGHGIQIQQGPYAGRLIIPSNHRLTEDRSGPSWSHIIYSDDHGQTWRLGGGLDQSNALNNFANEISVVEQSDGGLYMSIRVNDNLPYRGMARSYDGGTTWKTMARDARLTTSPVQASLLRINANTVLLSAPDSTDRIRRQMTLWISHDDMKTWKKTKTVFYGFASYSDMVLAGPDTVLLAYNRGHATDGSRQSIGLARFNLHWLEGADSEQFTWHFNEELPGAQANLQGPSLQDYGPWDSRAQAFADSIDDAPTYVAGADNSTALALAKGSDSVVLTPATTRALQFGAMDSFTIEVVMRTTDSSGVILGSLEPAKGWSLLLTEGRLEFRLTSQQQTPSWTSNVSINDGQWHRIAVVRDGSARRLRIDVDGVTVAGGIDPTSSSLESNEPVRLGAYNDGTGQLAFEVDVLRITRAALSGAQLLTASLLEPPRFSAPVRRENGPDTLAGLQLWLPSYDYSRNFADRGFADPVPLAPVLGTSLHAAIDASPHQYRLSVATEMRQVLYAEDPIVGAHWVHAAASSEVAQQWTVQDSNGTSATNFDFVQSTAEFTLSTFIQAGPGYGSSMAIFDTAESKAANNGFSLLLTPSGALTLLITGPDSKVRFSQSTAAGLVVPGAWYHVAVVGRGPGKPISFYVTSADCSTVVGYVSKQWVVGANGDYPTDANHNLTIGSLSNSGNAAFQGKMVDQAIYNRALSANEIQLLFDFTKRH